MDGIAHRRGIAFEGERRLASIVDAIEQRVSERPDQVAAEAAGRRLTYGELDALANRLAHRLRREGVGRGDVVGVPAERGLETLVAALGTLKAAAAYAPLDPESPVRRTADQLAEMRAVAVAGAAHLVEDAPSGPWTPIAIDPGWEAIAAEDASPPAVRPRPDDLYAVIFTSGSTGRPKGIAVEHRNMLNLLGGVGDLVPQPGEAALQVSAPQFDVAAFEIWATLYGGGRLVCHPPGRPEPAEIAATITGAGVTWAHLATSTFHQLVAAGPEPLAGMRLVIAGGEVMRPAYARRFRAACPRTRLINDYGPAETTVFCLAHEIDELPTDDPIPIGRAVAGALIEVRDEDGEPVPDGERGELHVGGSGVSRGYIHRPELTAERFYERDGTRWYRTGDIVRRRPDAVVEIFGRVDDQVKIRGYRVEPREVEAVIAADDAVREAAVVAHEQVAGHRRLVAHVVWADGTSPGAERDLAERLADRLPAYMLPSAYVSTTGLPQTPNGKVDRRALAALPLPAAAGQPGDGRPSPPLDGELAGRIAAVFAAVLELPEVDPGADFIALGGDSLLAVQIVVRLREELGVELPIAAVFEAGSPAGLAELVARRRLEPAGGDAIPDAPPPLRPRPHRGSVPATRGQAKALMISELADESLPYQSQAAHRIIGELDVGALERALSALVARHEILRTTFHLEDGVWRQRVHEPFEVRLVVTDLRDEEDPERALDQLFARQVAERFDPGRLPLIRWSLARLADDDHALIVVEHHVVHDGVTTALLLRQLAGAYAAELDPNVPRPRPPAVQWRDFAAWQEEVIESEHGRRTLAHWRRRLTDLPPPPELPFDRPRPPRQTYRGDVLRARIPDELAHAIGDRAAELGATPFMLMLAAYAALLSRYGGTDRLVIGSGLANRRTLASEELAGMVVNTVPLVIDLGDQPTVAELVARVRDEALSAQEHQDVPFERVVEELAPDRSGNAPPIYQTLFSFHDSQVRTLRLPGATLVPRDGQPNGSAKADLNIVVINRRPAAAGEVDRERVERLAEDGLTVIWEYSTDLFDRATAERLLDSYLRLLAEFTRSDRPVTALPLSAESEARRLHELAGRDGEYERELTIGELFSARAAERPHEIAVEIEAEALTYRQLEVRANRLAHRLRKRGIRRGDRVGVCLERSLDLIVAILATLKAQAAYVPLDPRDPRERLRQQIEALGIELAFAAVRDREQVPLPTAQVISLDEYQDLDHEPDTPPPLDATALDAAYVMFTSGSTGAPKGVEVTHRAIARLVCDPEYVSLGPDETLLGFAPPAFDASTFEIWGALLNGGRLVLAPAGPLSLAELDELISSKGVTTLWLTAGLFHRVVDEAPHLLRSLRQLLAGGDVLSPDHVRRALAALPEGAVLINGYGPTEATTFTCTHTMRAGDPIPGRVPIGRPIPGTRVYILDRDRRPVPIGAVGELWIGGDGVALGYAGDPALTAERFVPDPFASEPGARMYRSGDRARWRPDGLVEFLGRTDRQLKVRGFRIEPGEVEEAIRAHPAVADACVVATGSEAGERRLAAHVVLRPGAEVSDRELRRHVAGLLPPYAVPSAWSRIEELPLNANGKVDVAALPEVEIARARSGGQSDPADELERRLIATWRRVLGVDAIDPNDDFFELGGHSLLAVELFAAIEREFGRSLPLATIFEAPTVRGLAEAMRAEGWRASRGALVKLNERGSRQPLFIVPAGDFNSVGFGALARRLGPEQPIYVLRPRGIDGGAPLQASVERMARQFLRAIRQVSPHGPYLLAGRCLGVAVAYETARRLVAAGEEVPLLVMLDSSSPLWRTRRLADGTRWDPTMNHALRRAGIAEKLGDPFTPAGTERLLAWLSEPEIVAADGTEVNRYLAELYRQKGWLREAFPDLSRDAAGYLAWVAANWHRHDLPPRLIPGARRVGIGDRLAALREPVADALAHLRWRLGEALDLVTLERRPGAQGRRLRRIQEASLRAWTRYRAGDYPGRVTLIRSDEYATWVPLEDWYGLRTGGVAERRVPGTHRSMLREPDVAGLARCLEELIDDALDGNHRRAELAAAAEPAAAR